MPASNQTEASPPEAAPTPAPQAAPHPRALDLHALAEKVFALLKEELRVEHERSGRH